MGCAWWCPSGVFGMSYGCGFWLFTGPPSTSDYVLFSFRFLTTQFYRIKGGGGSGHLPHR